MKRIVPLITLIAIAACATAAFAATQGPLLGSWSTVTTTGTYTPRSHAATAFGNNRIFVLGGVDAAGTVVGTNEALRVTTSVWAQYAAMPTARRDAAAVTVRDSSLNKDFIYVIGGAGDDGTPLTTVEVLDTVTFTWTTKSPMANPRAAIVAVAVTVAGKQEIHVYGSDPGAEFPANIAYEIYDVATDTWRGAPHNAPSGQSEACGVVAQDLQTKEDYLYLFGGYSGGAGPTSSSWRVDADHTDNWDSEVHNMPDARIQAAAVTITAASPDGGNGQYPVIIGGNSDRGGTPAGAGIMVYESGIYNGWVSGAAVAPDLPERRGNRPGAIVAGGSLWVVGGSDELGLPATAVFKAPINAGNYPPAPAIENPLLVGWENVNAPIPTPRWYSVHAAVGGKLYVMGGWASNDGFGGPPVGNNEAYDPATNTWSTMAPMPVPVRGAACAAIGTKIYVAGGSTEMRDVPVYTNTLQIYDTTTDQWTIGAPMPTPRDIVTGFASLGQFHVLAGMKVDPEDPTKIINTGEHEAYDPATNTWSTLNPPGCPWPMGDSSMCTVQSGDYVWAYLAGGTWGGSQLSLAARWNTVTGGPFNDAFGQIAGLPVGGNSGHTLATVTDASGVQWPVVFGGHFGPVGYYNKVFVYHDFDDTLFGNQWLKDTSMPYPRGGRMAVAQIGNYVYVTAGMGPLGLAADTWRSAVGSGLPVDLTTIGEAIAQPNGKKVAITEPKVVTRTYTAMESGETYIWIEETDRSRAIRVGPVTEAVNPGNKVTVSGRMTVDPSGQRTLVPSSMTVDTNIYDIPKAVGITNRSFGGGTTEYQPGRPGGVGLNNMGMLVTIWGKVTVPIDFGNTGFDGRWFFYLDDGTNLLDGTDVGGVANQGVRVYCNMYAIPGLGQTASVTGIISAETVGGIVVPMLISDEVTRTDDTAIQIWD